jgi:hypothetical protein
LEEMVEDAELGHAEASGERGDVGGVPLLAVRADDVVVNVRADDGDEGGGDDDVEAWVNF